jgi:hypothetical protein
MEYKDYCLSSSSFFFSQSLSSSSECDFSRWDGRSSYQLDTSHHGSNQHLERVRDDCHLYTPNWVNSEKN